MIAIGNRVWRTLADPIYVDNDTVVREVYVNGDKVYPEEATGTLVKFRGVRRFNETRTFGQEQDTADTTIREESGTYTSEFNGVASFAGVAIINDDDIRYSDGEIYLNGNKKVSIVDIPAGYYMDQAGSELGETDVPIEALHDAYYNPNTGIYEHKTPLYGAFTKTIRCRPTTIRQYDSVLYNTKILYKQNISPFRISQDQYISMWHNIEPTVYYRETYNIYNSNAYAWMLSDHNNKVYTLQSNGSISTDSAIPSSGGYANFTEENSHIKIRMSGGSRDDTSGSDAQNTLYVEFSHPDDGQKRYYYNVSAKREREGETIWERSLQGYAFGSYFAFSIPITEILYIGDYATAPEWAKDVTESDLITE